MEYQIESMVLDGWKIVRRIGNGASGTVYEVQKQKDDITLSSALKVMRVPQDPSLPDTLRGDGMDEGSVTRYLQGVVDELIREIKIMVELKGFPYTVNCEDYEVLQDQEEEQWDVLIRMELLTPLQKYQQGRSLTEKDVYRMAVQLAEALCLFEDEKIIHRDIKPENIFLNKYGTCKIGDFGIARAYDRATGELSKKGTENYMAPEVYWGEDYGHTVDIYSLGLVLYKLMNKNRLPFYPLDREYTPSDRQRALAERMRGTRELEPPACASAQFGQIILKMCAYRPEDRYPDAKTLQRALEEYIPSNQVVLDDGRSIDGARTSAGGKTGVASTGQTQEDLDETNVMFGSSRSLRGLAKTDDGKVIAKSDSASVGDGNDASGKTSDSAEQTDEKSGPERTVGPEVTADSRTQTPEYEPPRAAAAVRRDTGYDAAKTRQRLEELAIENRKQREKRRKICRFALEGAAVLVILVAIISPLWKSRKFTLTVDGGSGSGSYKAGETVTVQAEVPEGSRFTGWTSDGVTLTAEEETDENLEITMPSKKVTLTAGVEEIVESETTAADENEDGVASFSFSQIAETEGTVEDTTATVEAEAETPSTEIVMETEGLRGVIGSYPIKGDMISGIHYLNYRYQSNDEVYTGEPQLTEVGTLQLNRYTEFVPNTYVLAVMGEENVSYRYAFFDLTGKRLTDFEYSSDFWNSRQGWIVAQREKTGKYGVLSMSGEEVIPASYSGIEILSPYWIVAFDEDLENTVLYHMDDDKVSYMRIEGCLLERYRAQEEYLNIEVDGEAFTLSAWPRTVEAVGVVQRTGAVHKFNGLTKVSALEQKFKDVYGDSTSVTNHVIFGPGSGFETDYVIVDTYRSGTGTVEAVTDKDGDLILPFSKLMVQDYSNGYFLLSGDDGSQFVRKDGTLTGESNDHDITLGIAIASETEDGTCLLEAADGTKTECGTKLHRTGNVGKLWFQESQNDYTLLDWHGNVLLEHLVYYMDRVSMDEKFLLAYGERGLVLYAVDGASVDDVVATAN